MKNKIVTQGCKVTLVKVPQVYESSIQNQKGQKPQPSYGLMILLKLLMRRKQNHPTKNRDAAQCLTLFSFSNPYLSNNM